MSAAPADMAGPDAAPLPAEDTTGRGTGHGMDARAGAVPDAAAATGPRTHPGAAADLNPGPVAQHGSAPGPGKRADPGPAAGPGADDAGRSAGAAPAPGAATGIVDGVAPDPAAGTAPASVPASSAPDFDEMAGRVGEATALLKALAHDGRLLILCHLATGERSVGALEALLGQRQATVSQQLARLREEGLVSSRPVGKSRVYRIADPRAAQVVKLLHGMFCDC